MNSNEKVCKAFNRRASTYAKYALMQQEVGNRMLERLNYFKINPKRILDLGCGNGYFSSKLKLLYPHAVVIGADFALNMLMEEKSQATLACCANILHLPFESESFDFIFSNQVIHWADSYSELFQEMHRVLTPGGCFLFSTLGSESFKELNQAWAKADLFVHAHDFPDMHDIGDELMNQNFLDPVMDRDEISIHYSSVKSLLKSVQAQGVSNIHPGRNKGLTTPRVYQKFVKAYEQLATIDGSIPLSYEIIQGHAWKGLVCLENNSKEILIPIK